MRRIAILALTAACALGASVPAIAGPLRHRAAALYAEGRAQLGPQAVGRDIVRDGYRAKGGVRKPRKAELRVFISTLDRKLHPPALKPLKTLRTKRVSYSTPAPPTAASSGGGAAGVPACASESGTNYSMGPDNTNASGASGRYQIMPFHWSTDCAGLAKDPAGQDKCASIIYKDSGASAWVGCGG